MGQMSVMMMGGREEGREKKEIDRDKESASMPNGRLLMFILFSKDNTQSGIDDILSFLCIYSQSYCNTPA